MPRLIGIFWHNAAHIKWSYFYFKILPSSIQPQPKAVACSHIRGMPKGKARRREEKGRKKRYYTVQFQSIKLLLLELLLLLLLLHQGSGGE